MAKQDMTTPEQADLQKARAELADTVAQLATAQKAAEQTARAKDNAEPEAVLEAHRAVVAAQTRVVELEALASAWRKKVRTLELSEGHSKLGAAIKAADPSSFREELRKRAEQVVPLLKQISKFVSDGQMTVARQGALVSEAERIAKELGEPISVERLPALYPAAARAVALFLADAQSVDISVSRTKSALLTRVLMMTGHISSEFEVAGLLAQARPAGLEDPDAVIAAALDGTLAAKLQQARRAKELAEQAKRAARAEAAKAYEAASRHFPYDSPRDATAAQRKALEEAEIAHLGEAAAQKLRERRGHAPEGDVAQAAE